MVPFVLAFSSLLGAPVGRPVRVPDLGPKVAALVRELDHVSTAFGGYLWADWHPAQSPLLVRTRQWEYLRHHPSPPGDFRRYYSAALGESLWVRPTSDTQEVQAAFPIGGVMTAVISPPDSGEDPCKWVLKAAHELFHTYQGTRSVAIAFVGPYRGTNDLTFPFPYGDSTLNALWRLEAESVFLLATGDSTTFQIHESLLPLTWRIARRVLVDTLVAGYKTQTEWSEGVARYTERRLADMVAHDSGYTSDPEFRQQFPTASYAVTWQSYYAAQLAPIRFVGAGVRGRTMFYYLGMGKAYALDRIAPKWRERYLSTSLDSLLAPALP